MTHEQLVLQALNLFLIEQTEKWEKLKLEPGYKAPATFYLDAFEEVKNFIGRIDPVLMASPTINFFRNTIDANRITTTLEHQG